MPIPTKHQGGAYLHTSSAWIPIMKRVSSAFCLLIRRPSVPFSCSEAIPTNIDTQTHQYYISIK